MTKPSPFLDLAPILSLDGQAICVWVSSMIWNRGRENKTRDGIALVQHRNVISEMDQSAD